jgi:hypothetical protein
MTLPRLRPGLSTAAEVQGLTALLDEVMASREKLRRDRDAWRQQATLALTDQTKPGAPVTVPSVALEPRRPWWRRLVRA